MQRNIAEKKPSRYPIHVGLKIPIHLVDDEGGQGGSERTDRYFEIVELRGDNGTDGVADIKWPNGHIDTNVSLDCLYGDVANIPRSEIHRFTGDTPDEPHTNEEKIAKLLEILEIIKRRIPTATERFSPPVGDDFVTGPENSVEAAEEVKITRKTITAWFRPPSKGGKSIATLRECARKMGIENPQKITKAELKKKMLENFQDS